MTGDGSAIDFRTIVTLLYDARIEALGFDAAAVRFTVVARPAGAAGPVSLTFEGVSELRWRGTGTEGEEPLRLTVVGLERLAPGDVWRLYAVPRAGAVLELSCRAIQAGGEVTGVGRSFRDRPAQDPTPPARPVAPSY